MRFRRKAQRLVAEGVISEEELEIFFHRIRERRVELGINQTQLAEKLGVVVSVVSRLENGTFPNRPSRIVALAKALGVTTDWLLGMDEITEKPSDPPS